MVEFTSSIFSGPFKPSDTSHSDPAGKITSGWIALPPVSGQTKANLTSYNALCDRKKARAIEYANSLKGAAKKDELAKIQPTPSICGMGSDPETVLPTDKDKWDAWSESKVNGLYDRLTQTMPVTFVVDITETRNVNQFLLNLSQALAPDKNAALKTAVVGMLDPTLRRAEDVAEDSANVDYRLARATFDSSVIVYRESVEILRSAERNLLAAVQSKDKDKIAAARVKVAEARTEQLAKKREALSAYKLLITAAAAARVELNAASELAGIT